METLHIGLITLSEAGHRVEAELQMGAQTWRLYFQTKDAILTPNLEAYIALALIPCMKRRISITAEGQVSPTFLENIHKAQETFLGWKPRYGEVQVQGAIPKQEAPDSGERVGVFFSAGIDSLYSLITNREDITDLVTVYGFDVPLVDLSMRGRLSQAVRNVGAHFDKGVIEIETNARLFLDEHVTWGFTHGAVLASVGHLLGASFRRFHIAGTSTHGLETPYGSHSELDPHWGSEGLEFIHDGLDAWKIDKVAIISEHDVALQNLRVCLWSPETNLNCGKCIKCLVSMVFLRTVGALERCPTFEAPLDLELFSREKDTSAPEDTNMGKCLQILEREGRDPELAAALHKVVHRPEWQKQAIKKFRKLRKQVSVRLGK